MISALRFSVPSDICDPQVSWTFTFMFKVHPHHAHPDAGGLAGKVYHDRGW